MGLELLSLAGKRALITGGGTGLGKAMALGLAEAGADLVICGRRRQLLESTAAEARTFGADVSVITADVTDEADVQLLKSNSGRIDILINNAGLAPNQPWTTVSLEEWRKAFALNLDAPFRLCQIFAPPMMERRWGRIINIASVYGTIGGNPALYPGHDWDVPSYFASKHGVHGITHYLAPRLAPFGVCINSISPGGFAGSDANDAWVTEAMLDAFKAAVPMARIANPEELKAAAVFLSSPGASYVTGHNLLVDGGWTIW